MNDIVSIIMPAYNAANFIAESIESVIHQSYTKWELLIVDDGSVDNTSDVIKNYQVKDPRIKYYRQRNGKQGKARNLALSYAVGKYIAFLDADDVWLPEKLDLQVQEIINEEADVVFAEAKIFHKIPADSVTVMKSGKGVFEGEKGLKIFLEQNQIPILTAIVKADVLKAIGGFTELPGIQNAEDYHLWLRLLMEKKKLYGSEIIMAGYREHQSSSTISDKLSVAKVIEALEDLKYNYKPYNKILTSYQKKWFKKYHYLTSSWSKTSYKALIKKNCLYINKRMLNIIFQSVYMVFGLRTTRKMITKILNQPNIYN